MFCTALAKQAQTVTVKNNLLRYGRLLGDLCRESSYNDL